MSEAKPFWEGITDAAYWQVVLAFLVAYVTYYFTDRSRRRSSLARAKSEARRYGYMLQQAWSNRLQSELDSNYYELMIKFTTGHKDKKFFRDMAWSKAQDNPPQSSEVSKLYGELINQYGLIEQLAKTRDYEKVKKEVDSFVHNHRFINIHPPDNVQDAAGAKTYHDAGKQGIQDIILREIRRKNQRLTKKLDGIRLKLF